ncbi:hypothetical protein [Algibacter sp. L4_22]|uniref:hypothetical protein n=1 Tax=Algibacter sp. L4_22 TaxID=2942477 RepID=UPI00201B8089|nr:hypothetical protein [Algibacter sp. L4_22]MCL5128381.1 hypothetical protein [Algibacter sp. L4_22]
MNKHTNRNSMVYKTLNFSNVVKLGIICAFFGFTTINAQRPTLKQELINDLKSSSFEEFVVTQKDFVDRSPSIIENETLKRGFICNEDNDQDELKFTTESFETTTTFDKPKAVSLIVNISEDISFQQSFGMDGSIVQLILNVENLMLFANQEYSNIAFKTTIHNIKYKDGSSSQDEIVFNDLSFEIDTIKEIVELKMTLTIEYPKLKVYKITEDYQKITEGDESIEVRFKENKVQIIVPQKNTEFLSLDDSQQIGAIHKSKKNLEVISSSSHPVLNDSSMKELKETIEIIKTTQNKVDTEEITTKEQLMEAMKQLPDTNFEYDYYTNNCYYGDIEEVLFYYNTKENESITEEVIIKPFK